MNAEARPPRLGIVIPVHRHSVLVAEAIESVINQRQAPPAISVMVNDGCPIEETARVIRSMAQAYPTQIINFHTPNGGLSAARNRGIQLLLDRFPSIEGIFLLDADNRLEPDSFRLFEQLLAEHPDADWFYPQFDMFGLTHSATHGGDWSLLMHTANNICEAGSLVRRRVFDCGIRYDETMRLGYEDWDFWLSAAREGFRGMPVPEPFFRYRKRPESMLSGSHRVDGEIRSYIRRKHAWLFNPRTVTKLEHHEAPRVRALFADSGRILSFTDPLRPLPVSTWEELSHDTWRWIASPVEADAGAFWIVTTETAWSALTKAGLLRWVLWDIERRLQQKSLSALILEDNESRGYAIQLPQKAARANIQPAMIAINCKLLEKILLNGQTTRIKAILNRLTLKHFSCRLLQAEGIDGFIPSAPAALPQHLVKAVMALFSSRYRSAARIDWQWRAVECQRRDNASHVARDSAGTGTLYPMAANTGDPPSICFLLSIAQFGGTETVALNVAAAMRRRGWRASLCVIGSNPIRLADRVETGFDEILWFPESSLLSWTGTDILYHGTHLACAAEGAIASDLLGLLGGFDCVMGCHPAGAVSVLGPLRKMGVVTALHEHVVEVNQWGRQLGPPILALAHEAAVDLIATCSNQLADWLHAQGVPRAKLVPVPNAAGYQPPKAQLLACLEARRNLPTKRPLRVLFLGRHDWQKGVDRLIHLIRHFRNSGLDIEWRVVGKAVVENQGSQTAALSELLEVESPVHSPEAKSGLYAWADVVLLPSRYEGLPLTVFEAQQLGAVPVMTKVGAFTEAIDHDINGILVDEQNCLHEMIEALSRLASQPAELRRLSEAAAARQRTWDVSAAALISMLEAAVTVRRGPLRWKTTD